MIRLKKVEQLAIFSFSPCRSSLVEQLAAVPGFNSFCQPCKQPSFSNVAHGNMLTISGRYMPSGMVTFSFAGRW
jgi:hypothetical protein